MIDDSLKTIYRSQTDFVKVDVLTTPTFEPVTIPDMKEYLGLDHDDMDGLLRRFIDSAIETFQRITRRSLAKRILTATFQGNEYWKQLPFPMVGAISRIERMEDTPVTLVLDTDYWLKGNAEDYFFHTSLTYKVSTGLIPYDIEVDYESGYGTSTDIPEEYKTKVKEIASYYFNRRDLIQTDGMLDVNVNMRKNLYPFIHEPFN